MVRVLYNKAHIHFPDETVKCFSVVTTKANTLMTEIHNSKKRMPVVLHPDEESIWLNGKDTEYFEDRTEIDLVDEPVENFLKKIKAA